MRSVTRASSERIVASLFEHRPALARAPGATWRSRIHARLGHSRRQLRHHLRDRRRRESNSAYMAHKFPGIDASWVDERIARFRRTLGRFHHVQARQLGTNLFRIQRG